MNFSKLTKKINTDNYIDSVVEISQIKAQYNPDRFGFWKSLHEGPEEEVLNMMYSSHYRLLDQYVGKGTLKHIEKTAYYKLQQLYGRNDKWIRDKINKFNDMYNSIYEEGLHNNIHILRKPLVKNKYNDSFEIFEGHHRFACCLVLGVDKILCNVIVEG